MSALFKVVKKVLLAVGWAIDRVAGAAGGLMAAGLASLTLANALRLADARPRGLWAVYLGLLLAGPLLGLRYRAFFVHFIAPLFNSAVSSEGAGELGPDTSDTARTWLMQVLYLIALVLLVLATVFAARTPLLLSAGLLFAYALHAARAARGDA